MSKLSSNDRASLPKSSFGQPAERKYPMPDKTHAANAKARASQQVAKGNLSKAVEAKIDAKANRILGKSATRAGGEASPGHFAAMKRHGRGK